MLWQVIVKSTTFYAILVDKSSLFILVQAKDDRHILAGQDNIHALFYDNLPAVNDVYAALWLS